MAMIKIEATPHAMHTPMRESQIRADFLLLTANSRRMREEIDAFARVKEMMKKISLASTPWKAWLVSQDVPYVYT